MAIRSSLGQTHIAVKGSTHDKAGQGVPFLACMILKRLAFGL